VRSHGRSTLPPADAARTHAQGRIPTVDLSRPDAAAEVGRACREAGFFVAAGHGVPEAVVGEMFDQLRALFALPAADKMALLQARRRAGSLFLSLRVSRRRGTEPLPRARRHRWLAMGRPAGMPPASPMPHSLPRPPPPTPQDENNRGYTPLLEETLDPSAQTKARPLTVFLFTGRLREPLNTGVYAVARPSLPAPRARPVTPRAYPCPLCPRPDQGDTKEGFYFGRCAALCATAVVWCGTPPCEAAGPVRPSRVCLGALRSHAACSRRAPCGRAARRPSLSNLSCLSPSPRAAPPPPPREVPAGSPEAALPLHGPNVWPPEALVPGFRAATEAYFSALTALGFRLLRLLAESLGLPPGHFDPYFGRPMVFLRPLRYSAEVSRPGDGVFGAGAHTDYVSWWGTARGGGIGRGGLRCW
jgi:isopenicillin N synthase-like dioxygenase